MKTKKQAKKQVKSKTGCANYTQVFSAPLKVEAVTVEDIAADLADLIMSRNEAIIELENIVYGLTRRVTSLEAIVATQHNSRTFTGTWHG